MDAKVIETMTGYATESLGQGQEALKRAVSALEGSDGVQVRNELATARNALLDALTAVHMAYRNLD